VTHFLQLEREFSIATRQIAPGSDFFRTLLVEIQRIKILGCGSAYIAGCLGAHLIERRSTTLLGEIDNRRMANGEHQRV